MADCRRWEIGPAGPGLSPAECGIVVPVASDRTGDKVMRSFRMLEAEASRVTLRRCRNAGAVQIFRNSIMKEFST